MSLVKNTFGPLLAFAVSTTAVFAVADTIEMGAEYRDFNEPYSRDNLQAGFVAFNLNPVDDAPLQVIGKFEYRYMDFSGKRHTNNRYRQSIHLGYQWDLGDFSWAPKIGLRQQQFENNTEGLEYRFYPGLQYQLTDLTSVSLAGWMAMVQMRVPVRKEVSDGQLRSKYNDYIHKLEVKFNHRLSSTQSAALGLFHEMVYREDEDRAYSVGRNETVELRLYYKQDFGVLSLEPYARIDLTQGQRDNQGNNRHQKANRLGIKAEYEINQQFALLPEIYIDGSEVSDWNSQADNHPNKYYFFYGLSLKYRF